MRALRRLARSTTGNAVESIARRALGATPVPAYCIRPNACLGIEIALRGVEVYAIRLYAAERIARCADAEGVRSRCARFAGIRHMARQQLGTVGSGNHFVRLPEVLEAYAGTIQVEHVLHPLVVVMAGAEVSDPYKY